MWSWEVCFVSPTCILYCVSAMHILYLYTFCCQFLWVSPARIIWHTQLSWFCCVSSARRPWRNAAFGGRTSGAAAADDVRSGRGADDPVMCYRIDLQYLQYTNGEVVFECFWVNHLDLQEMSRNVKHHWPRLTFQFGTPKRIIDIFESFSLVQSWIVMKFCISSFRDADYIS